MCRDIFRELVENCVTFNTSTVAAGGQAYLVVNGLGIVHILDICALEFENHTDFH